MRVAAFTGGTNVPSARFRVAQYVPALAALGIDVDVLASRSGTYPPASQLARPAWLVRTLAERLPEIVRSRGYDLVVLQRELISTLETLERFTGRPRIFDVDDAIWLHRGGGHVRRIVSRSEVVIAGNSFLADYFRRIHRDVEQIPTAVDTDRFVPDPAVRDPRWVTVGWSGTSGGYQFFGPVIPALAEVMRRHPQVRLRIVSDRPPTFAGLDQARVDFVRWTAEGEVAATQSFDVGLMPLVNDEWCRGKCSYKMLLYMASGVASVVTPVGMNADVLAIGEVGLAATSPDEWVAALDALANDAARRAELATHARAVVERMFSIHALAPKVAEVFRRTAGMAR